MTFLVIITNVLIAFFIAKVKEGSVFLCIIPFFITILFSMEQNTDIYSHLMSYASKKTGFIADCIFWNTFFLIQWLLTVIALLCSGFQPFPLFLILLVTFPLLLLYSLSLKFKFINSRILRLLTLGLSISMPFLAIIFLIIFYLEIKNDSYFRSV